ncbi:MAG: ATP-binding cassette domain-containing protein [Rhodobacteraceae bacterium]|nr:ATP-binding cassette domain-containing protein [Paracoccaceae bacterium]
MPERKIIPLTKPTPQHQEWSVLCENLTLSGETRPIIDRLSCRLSQHGISAVLGENGAGKSMLLKSIAGLIRPHTGHVQLHPEIAGRTAMVFQKPVLLRRSARGNLDHALKIAGFGRQVRRRRIQMLLESCGLAAFSEQPARRLSGGEQQRLQMARALASDPKLLLMDEPCANLDPAATLAIEELIRVTARSGVKIILVTHNVGQARRLANEALFLSQGRLLEHSAANDLLAHPQSAAAQAFLDGKLLA